MAERGLLLLNLGSPQAPTRSAVKTYLDEFLMDPYVIDLPAPLRWLLVRGLITPFRAAKSAEAYRKIWSAHGSPLVYHTREFAAGVARLKPDWSVRWAMRYGQPSIASQLENWNIRELLIVPLYPQYAESSTRTGIERALHDIDRAGLNIPVRFLRDFFAEPEFIESEARAIEAAARAFNPDRILLSFHGLPEHHMTKLHGEHCHQPHCCDQVNAANRYCYRAQCFATAREIEKSLPEYSFSIGFQSRLGRRPWIKPYTDHVISEFAASGVKRVLVACPSFVADCLETLEEIQMRLREQFQNEGGEELQLVPALNSDTFWCGKFAAMVDRSTLSWERYNRGENALKK